MTNTDLELLIDAWRVIGTHEPEQARRRAAFQRMGELVAQRSPERIHEMESARGLHG